MEEDDELGAPSIEIYGEVSHEDPLEQRHQEDAAAASACQDELDLQDHLRGLDISEPRSPPSGDTPLKPIPSLFASQHLCNELKFMGTLREQLAGFLTFSKDQQALSATMTELSNAMSSIIDERDRALNLADQHLEDQTSLKDQVISQALEIQSQQKELQEWRNYGRAMRVVKDREKEANKTIIRQEKRIKFLESHMKKLQISVREAKTDIPTPERPS